MTSQPSSSSTGPGNSAVLSDDAPPRTSSSDIDNILAEMASLAEMATGDEGSLYDAALPTASGRAVTLDDGPAEPAAPSEPSHGSPLKSSAATPLEPAPTTDTSDLSDIEAALQEAASMLDAAGADAPAITTGTDHAKIPETGAATALSEDDELSELLADAEAERLLSAYEADPAQDIEQLAAGSDTDLADALAVLEGTTGGPVPASASPAPDEPMADLPVASDQARSAPASQQPALEDGNPWFEEVQAMEQAWSQGEDPPIASDAGQEVEIGDVPAAARGTLSPTGRRTTQRHGIRLLAERTCTTALGGLAWALVKLDRPFAGVPLRLKRLVGAAAWASLLLAVMLWLATPWIKPLMH